jgi:hypothetical protein
VLGNEYLDLCDCIRLALDVKNGSIAGRDCYMCIGELWIVIRVVVFDI